VAPDKRRPEAQDGMQTWMEIYPVVGEGFRDRSWPLPPTRQAGWP
jgi:hypothetical protein